MVLYPMFVHMYLELVYKGSEKEGKGFYDDYSNSPFLQCLILMMIIGLSGVQFGL